jgi:two-component system, NtrC family, response regulator
MLPKLLIVDDDPGACTQMQWALAQDFELFVAQDRPSALAMFRKVRPPVVTLDLGLPPDPRGVEEGFRTLRDLLDEDVLTKVIVATGQEERQYALEALGRGAYDFFRKPIRFDELKVLISRALHFYQLEQEHRRLQQQEHQEAFEGILGVSPQMQELFTTIRRVAITDASVVISGESGTGKELVAEAIHRRSLRQAGPFIAINCGAIPENLLESELFGHEKGAFTGAHTQRKGRIELGQRGTLLLDEIGELPLALQVKLLRFLQARRIERVGGRTTIDVDVRVLVATHVDLRQAIGQGRFREDLYYRLNVVEIVLPPLRERGEDILLLAKALLHRYAAENKCKLSSFDRHAMTALATYGWPGNVRELENRIRRAVIMASGPLLTPEDLGFSAPSAASKPQTLQEARAVIEADLIRQALAHNNRNISRTAAELGLSRPTLRELMQKYGLRGEL